jgi:hypothetical protein
MDIHRDHVSHSGIRKLRALQRVLILYPDFAIASKEAAVLKFEILMLR